MEAGADWDGPRTRRLGGFDLAGLTQISSSLLGFLYVLTFGVGSIVGMLVMSGLIGLPFAFTSRKLTHLHNSLQTLAGVFSIGFGIWYAASLF